MRSRVLYIPRRFEEAHVASGEAVSLIRHILSDGAYEAARMDLASSPARFYDWRLGEALFNHMRICLALRLNDEAFGHGDEAATILHPWLDIRRPTIILKFHAEYLHQLVRCHIDARHQATVYVPALQDAVALYRELHRRLPQEFWPQYMSTLVDLGDTSFPNDVDRGLEILREAVEVVKSQMVVDHETACDRLAYLAAKAGEYRRLEVAICADEESITHVSVLFEQDDRARIHLTRMLQNLAVHHYQAGHLIESLLAFRKATEHWRVLSEEGYAEALGRSVHNMIVVINAIPDQTNEEVASALQYVNEVIASMSTRTSVPASGQPGPSETSP